jgi:hypothetical protein
MADSDETVRPAVKDKVEPEIPVRAAAPRLSVNTSWVLLLPTVTESSKLCDFQV